MLIHQCLPDHFQIPRHEHSSLMARSLIKCHCVPEVASSVSSNLGEEQGLAETVDGS